ncbi:MAG: PepSY-associated TM helix domain-containing protein, partial [Burkholderiaceae bacterium]
MRSRSTWFTVPRWLGVGLGLWFALVGLTGSVLVFEDALDAQLNRRLLTTSARGPHLSAQAIVGRAEAAHPLGLVEKIRFPEAQGTVYRLTMRTKPRRVGAERIEAMFDPVSGAQLGARSLEALSLSPPHLLRTLYEFHRNVLLGNAGSNIVGIAGLLLLTSAVTGFVLAAPRTRAAFRRIVWINPRTSATRIAYDFHRSTGIVFAITLLLATLTGATLVYVNYVRDLVGVFSKVAPFPTVPWQPQDAAEPAQLDRVIDDVRRRFPEHTLLEVHGSPRQMAGHLYYLKRAGDVHRLGDTIAWINPMSGEMMIE